MRRPRTTRQLVDKILGLVSVVQCEFDDGWEFEEHTEAAEEWCRRMISWFESQDRKRAAKTGTNHDEH